MVLRPVQVLVEFVIVPVEFVTVLVLSVRVHEFYERASTGVRSISVLVEALSLLLKDQE
jgi:hypothetical protein